MIQISAYKLLLVSEQTILKAVSDIKDDDWMTPLVPKGGKKDKNHISKISFDWVLGHYAAVEDWFLHHLNGVPYELPKAWQDAYWPDTSPGDLTPENSVGRTGVTAGFQETRQRLYSALKFDLLHLNRCVKPGFFPEKVKTRGDAWLFISAHAYWHIGELNALRDALGYKYQGTKGINH